ncbi:MAG TPA: low affinity iron permease family protein [Steroidobacteraceae bacterium]|nr:low affinity iron permease family protein [Steroidobacteraceae bacterium]
MTPAKSKSWFTRFAKATAHKSGQPASFALATLVVVTWAVSGPIFQWSDTWQLVINTGTTIVTFLMVFLIQSTQNRDAEAVQIKLDELLRVSVGAHNVLMDLEELEEHELERIRSVYVKLAQKARHGVESGRSDEGVPEIGELVEKTKAKPKRER